MNEERIKRLLWVHMKITRLIAHHYANHLKMSKGEFIMMNLIYGKMEKCEEKNKEDAHHMKISDLSERLGVAKSAVSQLVNNLEEKGLVERITTKEDRRMVYVALTKSGFDMITEAQGKAVEYYSGIVDSMGEQDLDTLITLLERLRDAFIEKNKEQQ